MGNINRQTAKQLAQSIASNSKPTPSIDELDLGGDDDLGVELPFDDRTDIISVKSLSMADTPTGRTYGPTKLRKTVGGGLALVSDVAAISDRTAQSPKPTKTPFFRNVVLKPENTVPLANGGKIEIGGLTDADGTRFTYFRDEGRFALTPYSNWHGNGADASKALVDQGVPVVGGMKDVRISVSELKRFPPGAIVTKPGWGPHGFTLANGQTIVAEGATLPLLAFTPSKQKLRQGGTLVGWQRRVATPLADHDIASFMMMVPFAAPLLRLTTRTDNFGFEIVGSAGRGKSTLQYLAASAAGPAIGGDGNTYWLTLNTTISALETLMAEHNDMAMILDEAGLMPGAGNAATRAAAMRDITFKFSNGTIRHRFGEKPAPMSRFVYIISTNRSIQSVLGTSHDAESQALRDRLMSLHLPDRETGVFAMCPPEYASTGAFAEALKTAASRHYGHAIPAYLQWLVNTHTKHPKRLRREITECVSEFVAQSGANIGDGSQRRVAEAFGLVYASGLLAQRAGVLPASYRCMEAAATCYSLHRSQGQAVQSFGDRLRALMQHPDTIDMDVVDIAKLPAKGLAACRAFLCTGRFGARELFVPLSHRGKVFPDWNVIRHGPEVALRLKESKDRNVDRKPVGFKGKKETVYVFDVTDLTQ